MIKRKKLSFDELSKAIKTTGLVGLGEVSDFGTSIALGTTKTIQEAGWEKKVLLGGLLGNLAASVLDMDLPFANLGIESMAGIDAFVDNASDIAMGVAGASLGYKTISNIQEMQSSNKTLEEKLADLGFDYNEETENVIPNNININLRGVMPEQNKKDENELTEEQEKLLLRQLLKKYGTQLTEENL